MNRFCIPEFRKPFTLNEISFPELTTSEGQQHSCAKFLLKCCVVWLSIFGCAIAADIRYDAHACGDLNNNYLGRPTDYRRAPAEQRDLVEKAHFRFEHAHLQRGNTKFPTSRGGMSLMGGFDYTLRTFPNHILALQDIDRLGFILKTEKPEPTREYYLIECYFKRAVSFVPEDGKVRLVYGLYLIRRGKAKEAIEQLTLAEEYEPDDANVQYNMGLAYYFVKDYHSAKEHAKRAYELGFPLPGLKNMLKRVGQWD